MKKFAVEILLIFVTLLPVLDYLTGKNILVGTISNYVWVFCMLPVLYSSFILCRDYHFESTYFKVVFYLFLTYQLVIFFKGVIYTSDFLSIIKRGEILWALFIPFFVFFSKSLCQIRKVFNILYFFAIVFLILNLLSPSFLLYRPTAEFGISVFAAGCGFLFLNAKYLSDRKVFVSFLVLLMSALSYIYLARRSGAFTFLSFLFIGSLFNIINRSRKAIFKLIPGFVIGGAFFFAFPSSISSSLLSKMNERLLEDTRSDLFDEFFKEMNDDMFFGKGMNGTYYYPMPESDQGDGIIYVEEIYRNVVENGYLQLYLSGGILNVILFVLVLLPSAMMGIFKSANVFTRACGIMILLWLVDMFIYGLPSLSIPYILVWISAGFCFKRSLREKTDIEIFNGLNANSSENRYSSSYSKP